MKRAYHFHSSSLRTVADAVLLDAVLVDAVVDVVVDAVVDAVVG